MLSENSPKRGENDVYSLILLSYFSQCSDHLYQNFFLEKEIKLHDNKFIKYKKYFGFN